MDKDINKDKEIRWVGSSYEDLVGFPDEPRYRAVVKTIDLAR
jgi:phage-related protein